MKMICRAVSLSTILALIALVAIQLAVAAPVPPSVRVQWVYNTTAPDAAIEFGSTQGPNAIVYAPQNDTVFIQGVSGNFDGAMLAVSATTGRYIWAANDGTANEQFVQRSGITFGAGSLWVLWYHKATLPALSAFQGATGNLVVSHNESFESYSTGVPQPLYYNGFVFCGTSYMHAFDATNPSVSYKVGNGSQIAGENIAAYTRDGRHYILYPWGGEVTSYDITNMANITTAWTNRAVSRESYVTQNAVVSPDHSVVFTQSTKATSSSASGLSVAKLSTADGSAVPAFGKSGYVDISFSSVISVALADVVILAGSPVIALDATTGKQRWQYNWTTSQFGNAVDCVAVEGWSSVVLCTMTSVAPAPSMVLLKSFTGEVLASVLPPSDLFGDEAVFGAGSGYQPVVIKGDPAERSVDLITVVTASLMHSWAPEYMVRMTLHARRD